MPKFAISAMLVALAVAAQGVPLGDYDISAAAAAGNWELVHQILQSSINRKFGLTRISEEDLKNIRPQPGGRFYGEAESTFHRSSNDNGKIQEYGGGHKIINDNGKVKEFDFPVQGSPSSYAYPYRY